MLNRWPVLVPVFLIFQAAFVHWSTGGERLPAKPDLAAFPAAFGDWTKLRDEPVEPAVVAQLGADRFLNADYIRRGNYGACNLLVAWFQTQRGGASQPHSPQVCLPGAGWTFASSGVAMLDTGAGAIPVNQDVISQNQARAAVIYWYQTPRRAVASEWSAKFWTVADALRDRRTDTSIIRVVVWNAGKSDEVTLSATREFARAAYPALRRILPH